MFDTWRSKWRLRALTECWLRYRELVIQSLKSEYSTPEQENDFLRLKARLAAKLQSLEESLPASAGEESSREIAQITDLLKRHTSPRFKGSGEPWDLEEFDRNWHEHFIFLSKLKGMRLVEERARPKRRGAAVPTGIEKRWLPSSLSLRRPIRFALHAALVVLIIYLLGSALGVRTGEGGRFIVDNPGSFGNAVQNVLNALASLWSGIFGPIAATYGVLGTVMLLAVFLLAVGYWVHLRG